ncbi:MAG: ROK family protein [Candidatus Limnocylindria bacterium]
MPKAPRDLGDALEWMASEGGDATSAVLDAVRLHGAASRSEVAERTGFGRAVVTQRVAELIAAGLLDEGEGVSTGGRPARRLRFRSDAGHLLTADLGATSIDVALAQLDATVLAHRSEPADVANGPEVILGRVHELFGELLSERDPTPAVWGIGIGVPGPVEFGTGRPIAPPIMPGWNEYPIRAEFEARYGAPVWVDNDVNIMAMGDWRLGAARGHRNVVFVKIGTGIGAGLISDGVLHRGAQGAAGDVGHIQVADDRSVTCRCGNVGCLEALAGGQAVARDAELVARAGRSPRLAALLEREGHLSAESVAWSASHGDPASVELLNRSAALVGSMLASVVNIFNPSLIVIGGGVSRAGDSFLAAIRETVYRRSLPLATRDLRIVRSELGEQGGVMGAAAMVADELFSREQLAATLARIPIDPAGGGIGDAGLRPSRPEPAAVGGPAAGR